MSVKTYRAGTMREALAQVRRDLGGGAVILGTREVRRRRLFGLGTRELIEVTATDSENMPVRTGTLADSGLGAPLPAQFGEELSRLHAMVAEVSKQGHIDHLLPELPTALVPTYAHLLDADVPEALARRLVR
ncbi:MAG TPA: flagellar GTP-binding protein, partial [Isosphaeraceae bacterium]|nr:flagellar GTP-binding protein [Isosphaeraceae bacterium]